MLLFKPGSRHSELQKCKKSLDAVCTQWVSSHYWIDFAEGRSFPFHWMTAENEVKSN